MKAKSPASLGAEVGMADIVGNSSTFFRVDNAIADNSFFILANRFPSINLAIAAIDAARLVKDKIEFRAFVAFFAAFAEDAIVFSKFNKVIKSNRIVVSVHGNPPWLIGSTGLIVNADIRRSNADSRRYSNLRPSACNPRLSAFNNELEIKLVGLLEAKRIPLRSVSTLV